MAGKEAERTVSTPHATCAFAPREQKMKGRDVDRRVEEGECEEERNAV